MATPHRVFRFAGSCHVELHPTLFGAGALVVPSAPFNLAATVAAGTVTFTWSRPVSGDSPSSYVIEAGASAGASDLASFDSSSLATSLVVNGVPAGTYFVRVRARNGAGVSGPSNEVIVTVGGSPCGGPLSPTGLAVTVTGSRVSLTWSPANGATSYVIQAGSSPGLSDITTNETASSATALATDAPDGTYYVRVAARNACGTSGPSNEVVVVVHSAGCVAAPPPPSGVSVSVSGSMVTLTWGAASGAVTYVIQAGTSPGTSNIAVLDTGSTSTSLTVAAPDGTYYVRVLARNACGTSGPSDEATFRVGSVTANVLIVNSPNPVPWSGVLINEPVCAGVSNTWFFDAVMTEAAGVGVFLTTSVNSIDNGPPVVVPVSIYIPPGGVVRSRRQYCFVLPTQHTVLSIFMGIDARGSRVSFTAPLAVLQARTP